MKTLLGIITILFSMNVLAQESGLECTMTYKNSNPFQALQYSQSSWLTDGGQMRGEAVSEEFGNTSAHLVLVSKHDLGEGTDGWKILVYNSKNVYLGTSIIPKDGAMKVTYPVKSWATDIEDPSSFDLLDVSCQFAIFAG